MSAEAGGQMVAEREPEILVAEQLPAGEARRPEVFERLHALVRKGYIAQIGTETLTDVIVLRHLGKAPDLVLHPDGTVEPLGGRIPWHKRKVALPAPMPADKVPEQLRFMKFLETVPRTTLRDRTRRWRRNYLYWPVALVTVWLLCLGLTAMIFDF